MIYKKKVLAIILSSLIISALLCTAVFADGELLLQLNLTNMVTESKTLDASAVDASGITNNVSGWGGTINIHGKGTDSSIAKAYVKDLTGEDNTPVIHFTNLQPTYNYNSTVFRIQNTKFEKQDTTITFWAKITPGSSNAEIFDFRAYKSDTATDDTTIWEFEASLTSDESVLINSDTDKKAGKLNREWNHYAITGKKTDNGGREMQLYLNGDFAYSETFDTYNSSSVAGVDLNFASKWSNNPNRGYSYNVNLANEAYYGGIEVYKGALDESEIYDIYSASQADYAISSPNRVLECPETVKPDDESFSLTMENEIDNSIVKELPLKDGDGNIIQTDFVVSGNTVTIKPHDYLKYNQNYKVHFPKGYCVDFGFTTAGSCLAVDGKPNIKNGELNYTLAADDSFDAKVVVIGYDENGYLTVAKMQEVSSAGVNSISASGIETCSSIIFMVWQDIDGFLIPVCDTIKVK